MKEKLLKLFINIQVLLDFKGGGIFSSEKRKKLRAKLIFQSKFKKLSKKEQKERIKKNNKLIIIGPNQEIRDNVIFEGLNIDFYGSNSTVIIHTPINIQRSMIRIGNNSIIEIHSSKHLIINLYAHAHQDAQIYIGKNFSTNGCSLENHDEPNFKINIGEDCMFSYGINVRVSDGHTIYDTNSLKALNQPRSDIKIGNHVWIGMHSCILKNSQIASNCIVGAKSLITKCFNEENVIITGTPAKIIKKNINWSRQNTYEYEQQREQKQI